MVTDTELVAALKIVVGDPELVIVDARVLRLLMGDLATLIILGRAGNSQALADPGRFGADDGPYIWDRDKPCS